MQHTTQNTDNKDNIIVHNFTGNSGRTCLTSKKEFNDFFFLPYKLFKRDPMWVPSLLMDERNTFNRKTNPALEGCEYKIFVAYQNKKPVGRIVGIINHKANKLYNRKYLRFGWFDTPNDINIANCLFDSLTQYAKENNLDTIIGPMGFTDMDKEGMMVEGFETLCPMAALYNPSFYPQLVEKIGFEKQADWVQYEIPANQPIPDKVSRINNLIQQKYNLKIVEGLSKQQLSKQYGKKLFQTLNKSFANLYGYVPLDNKMIDYYIKQYFPFINKKLICIVVDSQDNVVAFGISMPSLSKALQKGRGKLFPFGWYYLIKALNNFEHIDLYLNGVDPDWQNKGVHSIYYAKMNNNYISLGSKMAIANPQLETNQASHIWTKYDSRIAIRRRLYIKHIQ